MKLKGGEPTKLTQFLRAREGEIEGWRAYKANTIFEEATIGAKRARAFIA